VGSLEVEVAMEVVVVLVQVVAVVASCWVAFG
jgi:hypothetical protein